MGSITTNLKLERSLVETDHLLRIGKGKRWQQRHYFFFPKTFINKHLEHLRVTMGLTLHGSTALFALPHFSQLSKCQPNSSCCLSSLLSPYLIFRHSGMFTIHVCNTYVIPIRTTPCTRVTILTQLCCSLGA